MHGLDPADAMVIIEPSAESLLLTTTQIVGRIKAEGSQLAVVLLPMVQYYTGQVFDIEAIAAAAHSVVRLRAAAVHRASSRAPLQFLPSTVGRVHLR